MKKMWFFCLAASYFICCQTACSEGGIEEEPSVPAPIYSIEEVVYTIGEGDGVSVVTHDFDPIVFSNHSDAPVEKTCNPGAGIEYSVSSRFEFSEPLPEGMDIRRLHIDTPDGVNSGRISDSEQGWLFTSGLQARIFDQTETGNPVSDKFTVRPGTKVIVSRSYDQKILRASFAVTMMDEQSGKRVVYQGKWTGSLLYGGEHKTTLSEAPL